MGKSNHLKHNNNSGRRTFQIAQPNTEHLLFEERRGTFEDFSEGKKETDLAIVKYMYMGGVRRVSTMQ
jgi:hypothetical protein